MRDCVIDSKDAVRFLVQNSNSLGLDPDQLWSPDASTLASADHRISLERLFQARLLVGPKPHEFSGRHIHNDSPGRGHLPPSPRKRPLSSILLWKWNSWIYLSSFDDGASGDQ